MNVFIRVSINFIGYILIAIGLYSITKLSVEYRERILAKKTYAKNILLVESGMEITTARNLMGEFQFKEELGPKVEYEMNQDSTIFIRLVYFDMDPSEGFPFITFDPKTRKVVHVGVGEGF